jgi:HAD superfamily hydrolase (TIGR01509 family)
MSLIQSPRRDDRPPPRAVLFDFAGTLFMPRPAAELVCEAARTLGVDMESAECVRIAESCLAAGLPGGPYPAHVPDKLSGLYEQRDLSSRAHRAAYVGLLSTVDHPRPGIAEAIYEQILQPSGWVPYADAHQTIESLQARGVPLGLVSNVGFDLRPVLRAHGFDQLANHCTLSFEVNVTKPDVRIFELALQGLGVTASRTLMVGDQPTVDGGGAALGMKTLILPMTPPGGTHELKRVLQLLDETTSRSTSTHRPVQPDSRRAL